MLTVLQIYFMHVSVADGTGAQSLGQPYGTTQYDV